jgi:hypothetical protein
VGPGLHACVTGGKRRRRLTAGWNDRGKIRHETEKDAAVGQPGEVAQIEERLLLLRRKRRTLSGREQLQGDLVGE